MADDDPEWPPSLDVELNDRQHAIMDCYELMERLVEEYGGRGRIRRIDESTLSVELEYDIPPPDAETDG